jgi:hypothetical protein
MNILRKAWSNWKRIGQAIGDLIGRIVLSIFYFSLLLPFGLGVRLFGDPLLIKTGRPAGWHERKTGDQYLDEAQRLF